MTIEIKKSENQILAVLDGELDTAAAAGAEFSLQPLLASEGKEVVSDCTKLEYISSSGLRILLGILKQARAVGSRVVLKNVNDVIKDVLELTGFISIFEFE